MERYNSLSNKDKHRKICEGLTDLYIRKNTDYGDSFSKTFDEYGLIMVCIRLEDKLGRLKTLSKDNKYKQLVNDESIIDTLMDLANYSIMTLMELLGEEGYEEP